MKTTVQEHLLVNMDKKKIIEPAELIFSGESSIQQIAFVHPELGNPLQYELFNLLRDDWKGDRITLLRDTQEMRDYLTEQEGYAYHRVYKQKVRREVRQEGIATIITFEPSEIKRWKKSWKQFVNQFVLINYDSQLFMTIDQRLFRRTKNLMPYFILAQAEERAESNGSWSGDRIGIEPIGTPTFDGLDYVEMFRMIGDKSVCQLGVEEYRRRSGQQD